ncbi:hypothetical protein HELRODRAFT_71169, partial [Helobdella robusta]|uniref:Four and a half LIM domains protein 2 n=1 Tax=Helobdella robusta TaxID=6412 RepID=T1G0H3_HELRO
AHIEEQDEGRPCLFCNKKCTGFALHDWRNTCRKCKCARDCHDVVIKSSVTLFDRLGMKLCGAPQATSQSERDRANRLGYSWIPFGLDTSKVNEYMHQLDNNKIPRLGTDGDKYRSTQLRQQLPRQDFSQLYCRQLNAPTTTAMQKQSFEEFVATRSATIDVASVKVNHNGTCHQCDGELQNGDLTVEATKYMGGLAWHVACFTCSTCEELLVDMCYCSKDGVLYCQRHYAELFRPRCAACDELIFSGEYTKAMDQDWHNGHFACFNCDLNLTGHRYVLRDEHPYCIECYERLYAHVCNECKHVIGTDSKDLSYKDAHWHEKCFKCCDCHLSLVEKPFATTNNKLYCADCHDNNFAAKCDQCGKAFKSGMKKYDYNDKQYHMECFCCNECKQPIADQSFVPRNQTIVCVPCYEKHHAQRCFKCKASISKGGVAYKDNTYHKECFVCEGCSKVLSGLKFVTKDELPFCAECFNEKFAKKCHECSKPISGTSGNTKYVTFEDRQWHSDCFKCSMCRTSLVGQGFVLDGDAILCGSCIK